jgi:hypothetical protein
MAFSAGTRLTATLLNNTFPATNSSTQNTAGTIGTSQTTYTETLTAGTACSLTFVAPLSGSVIIHNSAFVDNSSTIRAYCSWIIRSGSTIGSGTTFLDGGDGVALSNIGADDVSATRSHRVTGLTPGSTYNIRQQFRSSTTGTTSTFSNKQLVVQPVV